MKLIVKILLGLVVIVVLVLGGAAAVLATLNPNDYKQQIITIVKDKTGRDLELAGDIKLLYYPVLGFEAEKVTLGNPADFAEKDFVSVEQAQAGIKILPLLSKKIELASINLVKPSITIIKKSDGHTNLEFTQAKPQDKKEAKGQAMNISIEDFRIQDARLTYIDKATRKKTVVDPFNLTLPGFSMGRSANLAMDMVISAGEKDRTSLKLTGKVKADMDKGVYDMHNLRADITTRSVAMPEDTKITITGDVAADMKAEKIALNNMKMNTKGTDMSGNATINGFKNPDMNFALKAPSIDLDTLAPPQKKGAVKNNNKPLLPLYILRTLSVNGAIEIGTLKASGLTFKDINTIFAGKNGLINIDPVTLNLYDGSVIAKARIDARGATPALSTSGALNDMQVAGLIKDKMGDDFLSGKTNAQFDLSSRGNTMNALNSNAGGNFNFDFADGYINKWQLSQLINQSLAYFETGKLAQQSSDKIYFTGLKGSFTGSNGVFNNNDLVLSAPKSHGLGSGAVNMRNQSVDYTVRVGLKESAEDMKKRKYIPVRIVGPFSAPKYSIDVQSMAMDAAREKIEEKKGELINKAFEKWGAKSSKEAVPVEAAPVMTEEAPAAVEPAPAPAEEDPAAAAKDLMRGLLGGQ